MGELEACVCKKNWFWKETTVHHIHVGMLEAWLGQNALWNVAGMCAMAKHPCFSPRRQKAACHTGQRAHSRPLNKVNVPVWKQHSSPGAFMRGSLHTHTHMHTTPLRPPHADHWPNRPTCFPAAASFSLNQVHRLPLFWLVALYLWINGERYLSPPQLSVQTTGAVSSLVVWTSLRCLFSFQNGDAICHLTFHKYFIVIIWQNHRTRAAESQRPQWQQEVLHQ